MIDMTEDEARKKWCPMARVHGMESSGNRTDNAQCIASDCACWVFDIGTATVNGVEIDDFQYDTGRCGLINQ